MMRRISIMKQRDLKDEGKLNRETIKYMAAAAMVLNHFAYIFLIQGSFLYEIFTDIGYFTAITMCFFLVEGYGYTSSKRKYGVRLVIFALVSQVPYMIAFAGGGIIAAHNLNMIFSLFICYLILVAFDRIYDVNLRFFVVSALALVSLFCDWSLFAPAFVLLFIWAGESKERRGMVFLVSAAVFCVFNFVSRLGQCPVLDNILYSLGNSVGIILAGLVIVYHYGGKCAPKGSRFSTFSKWFFYIFYPAHLTVLGLLRMAFTYKY